MADGVWLVVGIQASGKTTVADLLARQFDRGIHVRGGQFYRWAVRGWTHPWDDDQVEARRLLDLRYRLSATVATEYCRAGFTAVVQDNIFGEDVRTWLRSVPVRPRHLVVLRPSVAVVLERDGVRQRDDGKVAYRSRRDRSGPTRYVASAASSNVYALHQLSQRLVLSISVAPDDVATDHRVLLLV